MAGLPGVVRGPCAEGPVTPHPFFPSLRFGCPGAHRLDVGALPAGHFQRKAGGRHHGLLQSHQLSPVAAAQPPVLRPVSGTDQLRPALSVLRHGDLDAGPDLFLLSRHFRPEQAGRSGGADGTGALSVAVPPGQGVAPLPNAQLVPLSVQLRLLLFPGGSGRSCFSGPAKVLHHLETGPGGHSGAVLSHRLGAGLQHPDHHAGHSGGVPLPVLRRLRGLLSGE